MNVKIKLTLHAIALVSLIWVFAPSTGLAQDQGLPPCCDYSPSTHGHTVDSIFSSALHLTGNSTQISMSAQGVATPHRAFSSEGQFGTEAVMTEVMLCGNREASSADATWYDAPRDRNIMRPVLVPTSLHHFSI